MILSQLRVSALRNIETVELAPAAGINIIWGSNGAGKTTLLEAIYLLGRGRSFRDQQASALIRKGAERCTAYGRLVAEDGAVHGIGIEKSRDGIRARIDGEDVKKLSILARTLPLQVLTPRTHEILERGPAYRRRFLDWGVFHVEQGFADSYGRYLRALAQRNAALRLQPKTAFAWDGELAGYGERIDTMRQDYVARLQQAAREIATELLPGHDLGLAYRSGWSRDFALLQRLAQTHEEDLRRGHTACGPHRADLLVEFDGRPVDKVASRGEQKLVIAVLYLAQAAQSAETTGRKTVLLVDDLPAELDRDNRERFLCKLGALGNQAFVTGTDQAAFEALPNKTLFHVEQGSVSVAAIP